MTSPSHQPPEGGPSRGSGAHRPAGGGRGDDGTFARRRSLLMVGVLVVVVVLVAVVVWLFTAGPLSKSASTQQEIEDTLTQMSAAESFADFNEFMCAEQRVPQDLVDTITNSGEQTGTNLDSMFRESIAGALPGTITVTGVDVTGEEATVSIESGPEGEETQQVHMRQEDGAWKVCESDVGMGSVPDTGSGEQPG